MVFDLEKLIRDRQDELRGRPETWRDRFYDWLRYVDWSFVVFVACIVIWGILQIFIAAVPLLTMRH